MSASELTSTVKARHICRDPRLSRDNTDAARDTLCRVMDLEHRWRDVLTRPTGPTLAGQIRRAVRVRWRMQRTGFPATLKVRQPSPVFTHRSDKPVAFRPGFGFRVASMGSPRQELRALEGCRSRHGCRVGSTSRRWTTARRGSCCVTDRSVTGLMSMAIAERSRPEDDPTEQVAFVHRPMGTQF